MRRSRSWQRPDQIMDTMGIATDASVVGDIGAGSGWFTMARAAVGPARHRLRGRRAKGNDQRDPAASGASSSNVKAVLGWATIRLPASSARCRADG
jgi:hypothetical protein